MESYLNDFVLKADVDPFISAISDLDLPMAEVQDSQTKDLALLDKVQNPFDDWLTSISESSSWGCRPSPTSSNKSGESVMSVDLSVGSPTDILGFDNLVNDWEIPNLIQSTEKEEEFHNSEQSNNIQQSCDVDKVDKHSDGIDSSTDSDISSDDENPIVRNRNDNDLFEYFSVNKDEQKVVNVLTDLYERNKYVRKNDLSLNDCTKEAKRKRGRPSGKVLPKEQLNKSDLITQVATRKGEPEEIIEQCNKALTKYCGQTKRNALNAKINRERKKVYMQKLENDVDELRSENADLTISVKSYRKKCGKLLNEVEYLRAVLRNDSALSSILKNVGSSSLNMKYGNSELEPNCKASDPKKRLASSFLDHDYESKRSKSGVCLHVVNNNQVSIEFCAECSTNAVRPIQDS